ncbi:UpxY family transcription antiterminator [Arcticibacterium luteifluviistationis]|uniref:Antitermination protein NusG n=1 Tax=Arcticibacterium luteifluviistationis TaxID=1784714 RepID=A0A2Z4G9Y9_9BACT|nr:UpxY family transcription antiterminator [Arcticibacterium luteifluviistationis]AWV98052.1 antitermination protein NusG [Arcticibacterium luteifluviistationis]
MPWYVLYTKSRNEKITAERLNEMGIKAYCPVLKKQKQWSDRKKTVLEPLFKSYVFVNIEEKHMREVFKSPGVVRYLYWLKRPAIVKDHEIQSIKNMLNDFDHNEIKMQDFGLNDTVIFESGPFINVEGKVLSSSGKKYEVFLPGLQMKIFVDTTQNKLKTIAH